MKKVNSSEKLNVDVEDLEIVSSKDSDERNPKLSDFNLETGSVPEKE